MLEFVGIIAFIFAILFSIAWHELGHLLPAKKFGVKVTQYMIGFGPTIWSRKKGETEYGVKWVPFGGYIRMIGMFPPGPDGKVKSSSTGRLTAMIEDARTQAREEVITEEDERRSFYRLTVPKKLVVMLGGPVMNLILAFFLFSILLVGFGTPAASLTVSAVSECTPTVGAAQSVNGCAPGAPESPAAIAGLQPGDVVTSYNGTPMESWQQFSSAIRSSQPGPVVIGVLRDGQPQTRHTEMQLGARPVLVNGVPTTVANGTVALTGSTTNYVQLTQAGTVAVGSTRDPRYAPLYQVVTSASAVTNYIDERNTEALQRLGYGIATQAMADANQTITQAQALCETLVTSGALTATRNLVVPLVRRRWTVRNTCTGGGVQVIGATGTGTTVATLKVAVVECDGTNVLRVTADA